MKANSQCGLWMATCMLSTTKDKVFTFQTTICFHAFMSDMPQFRYMEPQSKCGDAPLILKQEANKNHNRKEVRKNIIYNFLIQLF